VPCLQQSVSEKQLAANRANAARSTGPRTPQGKARSAQNSRKHGFTASTFAIERIALAQQAILRAAQSRSSKASKPCGPNYRTNPFSTPTRTKRNHLHPLKTSPLCAPKTPLTVARRRAALSDAMEPSRAAFGVV
jgi:hypothetical protein